MIYRKVWNLDKAEVQRVRKAILADGINAVILRELPVTDHHKAVTTSSEYFTLADGTVIRSADHSSGIWIGVPTRTNNATRIDLNTTWSAVKLAEKILSIKAAY
jgi:hypothetical protein